MMKYKKCEELWRVVSMKDDKNLPNLLHQSYSDFLKSIDSFFHHSFQNFHNHGMFQPSFPVKTYETDTEFIIEAELPGVKKEQIKLDIHQNHVRIAVKHVESIKEQDDSSQVVSHYESEQISERIIALPFQATTPKAKYENGILTIRFPNRRKTIKID